MEVENIDNLILQLENELNTHNQAYNNLLQDIQHLELEAQNKREEAYQILNCNICRIKDKIRGLETLKTSF
jgi:hypothetical protein